MSIPKAKKQKKRTPTKSEQSKITEANYMCLCVAIEQLYSDLDWRKEQLDELVDAYWKWMTHAQTLQSQFHVKNVPEHFAKKAGEAISLDIVSMTNSRFKNNIYKRQAYNLCTGALVLSLRDLGVNEVRCNLIVGAIFYERDTYEPWSIYKECKEITGVDIKVSVQWD